MSQAPKPFGLKAFDLAGKTALITGAAGLLGQEHAEALLELGARVILTDVSEQRLADCRRRLDQAYPGQVETFQMNVASESSVARVAEQAGAIDILINNAAVDPKVEAYSGGAELSRLENFDLAEWDRQIAIGLTGAFLCARIIGAGMAERGGGVILNIASDLSVIAPDQRLYRQDGRTPATQPVKPVTYSVIKAGLVGLTRYLAGYWADQGIRVNALSPGGVANGQPEEFVSRLTSLIPLGRMAARQEYRAAVQFLCSPASSYMTGQNILMDGGRTVL